MNMHKSVHSFRSSSFRAQPLDHIGPVHTLNKKRRLSRVRCGLGATAGLALLLAACQTTQTQLGGGSSMVTGSGGAAGAQGETVQLPRCASPLGTLALAESEVPQAAQSMGLGSPVPLVRLMVLQSGCFRLVDRGRGFQQAQFERSLASGGQLQSNANVGDGQLVAADYIMTPNIISQNEDAGGMGGALSSLIPGLAGSLASNVNLKSQTAETMLTLTNTRTGVQDAVAQGSAKKQDIDIGGGLSNLGGIDLSIAGGGYEKTEIGKITAAAFLNAYANMVGQLQAMRPTTAAAPAPAATGVQGTPPNLPNPNTDYQVVSILNVREGPNTSSVVITKLQPGTVVKATGKHEGRWWIVMLPDNKFGWVHANYLRLQ